MTWFPTARESEVVAALQALADVIELPDELVRAYKEWQAAEDQADTVWRSADRPNYAAAHKRTVELYDKWTALVLDRFRSGQAPFIKKGMS